MTTEQRIPANWHFDCNQCFYCEMYLSRRHEHDHFPTPRGYGGTHSVPTCINCHDLKDRIGLMNWPTDGALHGVRELLELVVPSSVLTAHFAIPVPHEYPDWMAPYLRWEVVEPVWRAMSPIARVLYGKLSNIEFMRNEELGRADGSHRTDAARALWQGGGAE